MVEVSENTCPVTLPFVFIFQRADSPKVVLLILTHTHVGSSLKFLAVINKITYS